MRSAERALPLRHALALGLVQGPAELLPVSSSAHTTLLPWLAGWPYAGLDGERRKSFEVALHAGAAAALAIDLRRELLGTLAHMDRRRAAFLALSAAPPAIAGLVLGETVERRLGGPASIAVGLLAGAVAMALADARPGTRRRASTEAGACDGLALGIAQALALVPGVSRNGATLTAARARGFSRGAASSLSWEVALPVMIGASVLKGARAVRAGTGRDARGLLVGAGGAFASTLASARWIGPRRGAQTPLLTFALYRCALVGAIVVRMRSQRPGRT